ncbi:MAG: universal stress protein [bacterium]
MVKSILLSVDGSSYTEAVVKQGIYLANAFESHIRVVSVVDIRLFEWPMGMGADAFVPIIPSSLYQEESKRMLEAKSDAVLQKCSGLLQSEGLEFETEKIYGPPVDVICEKSYLVDLLIMGSRGEFAKWKSKLVGATLEAVVRQCNKPILITRERFNPISKILVAYDGSDKANKALQLVAFFGTKLKANIVVLAVHENDQVRNKYLQEADAYLEPYKCDLELIGVSGSPEKSIVQLANEKACDLIVIGAFGHSRIREAILGSTTEQVMRAARIPVLLSK